DDLARRFRQTDLERVQDGGPQRIRNVGELDEEAAVRRPADHTVPHAAPARRRHVLPQAGDEAVRAARVGEAGATLPSGGHDLWRAEAEKAVRRHRYGRIEPAEELEAEWQGQWSAGRVVGEVERGSDQPDVGKGRSGGVGGGRREGGRK